jgi:hypothetical protein
VRKAKKIERLRLPIATTLSFSGRKSAKFDQACFVRVQFEVELSKPLFQFFQESLGISTVLESAHEIIREPHDDYITACLRLPPLCGP